MATRTALVIGSGARENALGRALFRGSPTTRVVIAPGNAGSIGAGVEGRPIDPLDPVAVVALAKEINADLVVVGSEAPLVAGLVDALEAAGIATFGPSRQAARLEASKAFLKDFAVRHGIRTAGHTTVRSYAAAEAEIERRGAPVVVKADGLCAGKGVVVASSKEEAFDAARSMLVEKVFGAAGETVVIEECVRGREVSVHALSDGESYLVLPPARDHKRLGEGDRGPNTGGMGVIAPVPDVHAELLKRIDAEIIRPSIAGMKADGAPFRGVLFAGIMVSETGDPYLLEHNVRFGDPECEALLELIEGDLFQLLHSAARGQLDRSSLRVGTSHAAVVVLAAPGYPTAPILGGVINGLAAAAQVEGVSIHHAGTKREGDQIRVSGGRVLAVTGSGETLEIALERAYRAADCIEFEGKQLRRDIGR